MEKGDVVELAEWRAGRDGAMTTLRLGSPLLRLSRGEVGAVEACVDAYGPMVQALIRRLRPAASDVEDVVQEVFVALWRSAHRFDPDRASDRGFVAMITRRRVIDRTRREERQPSTVEYDPGQDRGSDEHERTLGRLQAGPAMDALRRLSEERRRWIVMAVVEGYSHREIAERSNTPLGTVKSGIRRGLAEMRGWLEGEDMQEVRG
ncbi:MAG: sigma-70 family RNA polymerase sigma factor [Gemmatimonadota bacterium]